MSGYLSAATVVLGTVATVNLVLTVGVIRRLRQVVQVGTLPPQDLLPKAGDQVGVFTARALDGTEVTHTDLPGSGMAVFLSPGCQPCERLVRSLTARLHQADATRTLVIVAGTPAEAGDYVRRLRGLATVGRRLSG